MSDVQVFRITRAAPREGADLLVAQGRGHGDAPDDALEVVQPVGLRARPVVRGSTEALVFELPNGDRFAFVIDKAAADGAVALEAGETQLRGCAMAASVVRLRASGDIEVTPAAGRHVVLAGGGARVAREGDGVRVTIPTGAIALMSPSGPVSNTAPIVVDGTITAGAERVRA